jgi:hypothetical protein
MYRKIFFVSNILKVESRFCGLAEELLQREVDMNDAMARNGATLVQPGTLIRIDCLPL